MIFTWAFLGITALLYLIYRSNALFQSKNYLLIVSILVVVIWSWQSAIVACLLTLLTTWGRSQNKITRQCLILLHITVILGGLKYFETSFSLEQGTVLFGLSYYSLHNIAVLLSKQRIVLKQLALNNFFFPRFFAGPILQGEDKLLCKANHKNDLAYGIQRILYGLAKKFVLADRLSIAVDNLLLNHTSEQSYFTIAIGAGLFTLEMYLDFSAYCDIALGTGRLFGVQLPENFNLPLRSKSITEYWRKTHISLIKWLTNNCYYPIVYFYRKKALFSVVFAIAITFLLSGIWHGLMMGFVLWGAINACYLITEFLWGKVFRKKLSLGIIGTFLLISFSNLFFKLGSLQKILLVLGPLDHTTKLLPQDWMVEFVAVMGNGGHLLQQYNLLEGLLLILLFFSFEKQLEARAKSTTVSAAFLFLCLFSIVFWGNFNAGQEFIYVQF